MDLILRSVISDQKKPCLLKRPYPYLHGPLQGWSSCVLTRAEGWKRIVCLLGERVWALNQKLSEVSTLAMRHTD